MPEYLKDHVFKNLNDRRSNYRRLLICKYIHNTYINVITLNESIKWCDAMESEINALQMNTYELTNLPKGKILVCTLLKIIKWMMHNTRLCL